MVCDETSVTEQRRLERHTDDVTDRQLARHRRVSGGAHDRGSQDLVEVRRHDPALRESFRALVTRGDHDRRDDTLGSLEAAHAQAVRMAGTAAEAGIERMLGPGDVTLLFESGQAVLKRRRKAHTRSNFWSDRISRGGDSLLPRAVHDTSAT